MGSEKKSGKKDKKEKQKARVKRKEKEKKIERKESCEPLKRGCQLFLGWSF